MKKRGFTLIELLVVIAIITILAGMVVGGFLRSLATRSASSSTSAAEAISAQCA